MKYYYEQKNGETICFEVERLGWIPKECTSLSSFEEFNYDSNAIFIKNKYERTYRPINEVHRSSFGEIMYLPEKDRKKIKKLLLIDEIECAIIFALCTITTVFIFYILTIVGIWR